MDTSFILTVADYNDAFSPTFQISLKDVPTGVDVELPAGYTSEEAANHKLFFSKSILNYVH